MKKQNGITLIALVITIIVMLILTGVTISLLLEEDGIIDRAKKVGAAQKQAELEEQAELLNAALRVDMLTSDIGNVFSDNGTDGGKIYNILNKNGLTPVGEDLVENNELMLESCLTEIDEQTAIAKLNIPVEDKNGNEYNVIVDVQLNVNEDGDVVGGQLENIEILALTEIQKLILEINKDIQTNPEDYTTQGTDNGDRDEKMKARVIKLYSDNGLEIEEGYLNEDGTDFGEKVEVGGSIYTMEFTIACSKDGERIVTVVYVKNMEDLKNAIVKFKAK